MRLLKCDSSELTSCCLSRIEKATKFCWLGCEFDGFLQKHKKTTTKGWNQENVCKKLPQKKESTVDFPLHFIPLLTSKAQSTVNHVCNESIALNKVNIVQLNIFFPVSMTSVYIKSCDRGVNLMSFDKNIQKNDANAHRATPPHPKSNDHEVLKIRAPSKFWAIRAEPRAATSPSTVPS